MATGDSSGFDIIQRRQTHCCSTILTTVESSRVDETVAGSLDHFSDWDRYSIHLKEGDTVRISTDSINVDTVVYVDFPKSRNNQIVSDDDSGGGLFGIDSELVYRAPHDRGVSSSPSPKPKGNSIRGLLLVSGSSEGRYGNDKCAA